MSAIPAPSTDQHFMMWNDVGDGDTYMERLVNDEGGALPHEKHVCHVEMVSLSM